MTLTDRPGRHRASRSRRLPARRSVHFGLNYPNTTAQLAGCVNDARDWSAALGDVGYTERRVVLEPTGEELLGVLEEELRSLRYGDRLVATYSGHGASVADLDGDEADRRDEALVASDYRRGPQGIVLDDQLAELFALVPFGARVLWIPDSCHSGTVSRAVATAGGMPLPRPQGAPRYLDASQLGLSGEWQDRTRAVRDVPATAKPRTSRVAMLTACTDFEVAFDATIAGRPRGAASWAYLRALAEHAQTFGARPALKAWHARAAGIVAESPYSAQHPQLEATRWQRAAWSL